MRAPRCLTVARGLLLAVVASGCATLPRIQLPGEPRSTEERHLVCERLHEQRPAATTVRAVVEAHVRVSDSHATSFRYGIVSKEPGLLRVDVLPLEGAFAFGLLVVREDGAVLIDATNKEYTEERDSNELIRQFLGIDGLTRDAVLALVTGRIPSGVCARARVYTDQTSAVVFDDGARIAYTIDVARGALARLEILDDDNERVRVRAETNEGGSSPREISLTVYEPVDATASMVVRKVTLNPVVPDTMFAVPIPAGYRRTN